MYDRIYFHYDHLGNFLAEFEKDDRQHEKPIFVDAKHCNAKSFYLITTEARGDRHNVPCVHILRSLGPIDKDPYNEDGRPPTLMCKILIPQIEIYDNTVTIEGVEEPNLCWAGLLTPPYRDRKPVKGARYMDDELKRKIHFRPFPLLTRQRVVLVKT